MSQSALANRPALNFIEERVLPARRARWIRISRLLIRASQTVKFWKRFFHNVLASDLVQHVGPHSPPLRRSEWELSKRDQASAWANNHVQF